MSQPSRLQCTPYLGPPVSIATNVSAQPSSLYTVTRPSRLYCNSFLGPPISIVYITSAQPSPLYTVPRPTRLQCNTFLGLPISIVYSTLAQPYQCDTLPRPIRLHRFLYSLLIIYPYTTFYAISLRPTPFYRVHLHSAHPYLTLQLYRPIRLRFTLFLGPSVSILHSIHY